MGWSFNLPKPTAETAMEALAALPDPSTEGFKEGLDAFIAKIKKIIYAVVGFFKMTFGNNGAGSIWDGKNLADLKNLVTSSEYNSLWANNSSISEGFHNGGYSGGRLFYTKSGFSKICALFNKILPVYANYVKNTTQIVKTKMDDANVGQLLANERKTFTDFLLTTELAKSMSDGKPFISDDVEVALKDFVFVDMEEGNKTRDLGWKSKSDVLQTIAELEKLQSFSAMVQKFDEGLVVVQCLEKMKSDDTVFDTLHDVVSSTTCMEVDFAKVMRQVTITYRQMVAQMQSMVRFFYNSNRQESAPANN